MTFPLEKRDHTIDARHAADLVDHFGGPDRGGSFHAVQVLALLAQEGAAYLHIAYGMRAAGMTLILFAVREDGTRIADLTLDWHFPCPPFCPEG